MSQHTDAAIDAHRTATRVLMTATANRVLAESQLKAAQDAEARAVVDAENTRGALIKAAEEP